MNIYDFDGTLYSGDSTVDTHFATSIVNTPAEELIEKSVKPFKKVVDEGLRAIMTSHACYMNLDPSGVPATISRKILPRRNLQRDFFSSSETSEIAFNRVRASSYL